MTQVSSLYLHVPFCKHLCNYCDFYKQKLDPSKDQIEDFHQFLTDSFKRHEELLSQEGFSWSSLETVYLGGGTPSLWGTRGAKFFTDLIKPIGIQKNAEFTMEVDPGTWTPEMISAWKEIGLNRISMGTQTLSSDFLKVMDRAHSIDESLELLNFLQKENWNFSLDFLLGIPFSRERKRDIKKELDLLLQFKPKHMSLYILNARSKYPHIQNMPDDEFIRDEYLFVSDYLKSHGFHHYEVSNFALPGFEAQHNQKYWRAQTVAALGPSGTGYLSLGKDQALRYKWKVTRPEVELENLGSSELKLEETYLSLRTSEGWIPPKGSECLMKSWTQQGFATYENDRVKLSSLGFLMLDSLMDDLFRWENLRK